MMQATGDRPLLLRLLLAVLRVLWTIFVITVPLVGVWIASALAALEDGPVYLAVIAGALAFPVLPLLWELVAGRLRARLRERRRSRSLSAQRSRGRGRDEDQPPILGVWDRIVLRTLAINLAFVGGVLAMRPAQVFEAVATRGDWMLDGVDGPWADRARDGLHQAAEGLEWLHRRTHRNAYEELVDERFTSPPPPPRPTPVAGADAVESETSSGGGPQPGEDLRLEAFADAVEARRWSHWPQPTEPHPLVLAMPAEAEASIASVAAYIVEHEPDPWQRTKAIHDYVATRIAYDHAALDAGPPFPPQDAQTTFESRRSVCAGYANLFAALVQESGGRAVVVVGDARSTLEDQMRGPGHAWNAVEVEGEWVLVDTTWDAGYKIDGAFAFVYSTDYLFVPAEVMGLTHMPDDPGWQLRAQPLERGEFLRQPVLNPGFFAEGFDLISPTRSPIVAADGEIEVVIGNRQDKYLMATLLGDGGSALDCRVEPGREIHVRCPLYAPGSYTLQLFANDEPYGSFEGVGMLAVSNG
ncbi:MAG: hypothetical protein KC457_03970 [Myxococcales bacterium]|nr:hypothetical protein [Myxococcales bacterium]